MIWLFRLGALLQLVGILVALVGVDDLRKELFPGQPPPHRAAWRRVKRKLGLKPPTQTISVGGIASMAFVAGARAQAIRPRPADDAEQAEWNAYVESRFVNLGERIDWVQEDLTKGDAEILERLADETHARIEGQAGLDRRLVTVAAGEGGQGLARTWYGLAITALGTLLQAIAGWTNWNGCGSRGGTFRRRWA